MILRFLFFFHQRLQNFIFVKSHQKLNYWDSPGDPVVKTLRFQCRGYESNPW